MSFTQDELDAFNTILDQRLASQRHELEQVFEQRIRTLRQDFDQHITIFQSNLLQHLTDQRHKLTETLEQSLQDQQIRLTHIIDAEMVQAQQRWEVLLTHHLQSIEQIMGQRAAPVTSHTSDAPADLHNFEIQTEIAWDDLIHGVDQALREHIASLNETVRSMIKNMEHYLAAQIHNLHKDLLHNQSNPYNSGTIQQIVVGIEQLERIIESMQVAMTANHALLSNRLYSHQQLPAERAHAKHPSTTADESAPTAPHQLLFPRLPEGE